MRFIRKAGAPAEKSPNKKLRVEPAELARKLAKEMDDHIVSRGEQDWARNRYTIYLCQQDYTNLAPTAPQLLADLKAKLAKHAAEEGYSLQADLVVEMVLDRELELGYFGILASKGGSRPASLPDDMAPMTEPADQGIPGYVPVAPPVAAPGMAQGAAGIGAAGAAAGAVAGAAGAAVAGAAAAGAAQAVRTPPPAPQPAPDAAYTQVMPAAQADELGLEGRVIVVTSGDQVMQFRQNRVVVGRSKEADLRVNDPNVSRKHAAIYWNNGRIMIDDLGSTNGTMVNGYPVTRTMLRPTDVVAIGDSRLTVEGK